VSGYPTIKYFAPGAPSDGEKYEGGREYNELKKFVKKRSKKPCVPSTLENCNKKDKAYLEEIKEYDEAKLTETRDAIQKEIDDLSAQQKEAQDLFEKQKEEAIATMKKAEEFKEQVSKLQGANGYKLLILKAKLEPEEPKTEGEEKKEEL